MRTSDLRQKIEIFNHNSPVKVEINMLGGSKYYLVVKGTQIKITDMPMSVNGIWDHLDTLENFLNRMGDQSS